MRLVMGSNVEDRENEGRYSMKKHIRIMLASVCAFAMVGAFALIGCSSNTEQQAGETQKPAEEQAKSESHEAVELQLFAANSLSKAMDAVQELYTQDHTWVTFKDTQYLSSGELNEQLAGGAYADVLISASKGKMDDAVEKGYVDEATRFDMFKNDLVMVASLPPSTLIRASRWTTLPPAITQWLWAMPLCRPATTPIRRFPPSVASSTPTARPARTAPAPTAPTTARRSRAR